MRRRDKQADRQADRQAERQIERQAETDKLDACPRCNYQFRAKPWVKCGVPGCGAEFKLDEEALHMALSRFEHTKMLRPLVKGDPDRFVSVNPEVCSLDLRTDEKHVVCSNRGSCLELHVRAGNITIVSQPFPFGKASVLVRAEHQDGSFTYLPQFSVRLDAQPCIRVPKGVLFAKIYLFIEN